jgi:hypothetical protein
MKTGVRFVAGALVAIILVGAVPPVARAQQPAQQPGMMQEQMKKSDDGNWDTVANVYNVAYVPGKALLCGLGGIAAFVLMGITFGTAYKAATATVREGCGGPWTLTADDVRPAPQEDFYKPSSDLQR